MQPKLHIGIDDTDTRMGGCTTYIASLMVEELRNYTFLDYPNLIRLNPNTPWKTRGNGALAIRILAEPGETGRIGDRLWRIVMEHYEEDGEKPQPALLLMEGDIPEEVRLFSTKAQSQIVKLKEARRLLERYNIKAYTLDGRERGIVGALAAIGEPLDRHPYTYEILYYRPWSHRHLKRQVNKRSVMKMDKETRGKTFHNIDEETGRILITPHGPDPVIFGIRGVDPEVLVRAAGMVEVAEKVERWMIVRTNQGTDAHLVRRRVTDVRPFSSALIRITVVEEPKTIPGGHVILRGGDESGEVYVAFYRETGGMRMAAKRLRRGDVIEVGGSAKNQILTLNAESLSIVKIYPTYAVKRPRCPKCGGPMASMGRGQGLRCKKCGYVEKNHLYVVEIIRRDEDKKLVGKRILPPPRSRRHLTKPENIQPLKGKPRLIANWYWSENLGSPPPLRPTRQVGAEP